MSWIFKSSFLIDENGFPLYCDLRRYITGLWITPNGQSFSPEKVPKGLFIDQSVNK
jgi:hypothetical protein